MGNTRYIVTVQEIVTTERTERGEYLVLSKEYMSGEEYDNSALDKRKEFKRRDDGQYERSVYGYAPDVVVSKDITREILKQEVANLNLAAVIRAINNI